MPDITLTLPTPRFHPFPSPLYLLDPPLPAPHEYTFIYGIFELVHIFLLYNCTVCAFDVPDLLLSRRTRPARYNGDHNSSIMQVLSSIRRISGTELVDHFRC